MPSATPSLVAVALGIKIETNKKQTLRRIAVTEGWVLIPVLIAVALAVTACIVPNIRAPPLHGIQFPCQFLLGLLQTVGRDIRLNLFPIQQRPSESRENLVSGEETEAQELENLGPKKHLTFDTGRGVWKAMGQERGARFKLQNRLRQMRI